MTALYRHILLIIITLVIFPLQSSAQDALDDAILGKEKTITDLQAKQLALEVELEDLRLKRINRDIHSYAIPALDAGDEVTDHSAMVLCYDEKHEQAKWVAHIILPQITTGNHGRSNDFREDPLIKTGTAVKDDYWDSGYDRGHLAPSADFRWSKKALSESYFYSNMSPQRPECNRQSWATLENTLRQYVEENNRQIFVVTGGVLREGLPTVGTNKVSIPEWYYKVVLDYTDGHKKAIAFLLPNEFTRYPIWNYAVSIDSVETVTGIDFFASLPDEEEVKLESSIEIDAWKIESAKDEAEPMDPTKLEKGQFNTIQAKYHMGDEISVCGTVVSTKYAEKSGNTYLNLDKKFPNQIFSITIKKENRSNFSYTPDEELMGKTICVTGKIMDNRGTPSMIIESEEDLIFLEE